MDVKATLTSDELRLVSLLPSTTEMTCALGLIDQLVGITHCCDYPPGICRKPHVVHSNLPTHELSSSELDARVIDGTELLAYLFHPELSPWYGPADAFVRVLLEEP